jgi:hypothetical protein
MRAAAASAESQRSHTERYSADPVTWATERGKSFLWSKQREIIESVRDNRRTAVPACHTAGKSKIAAVTTAWFLDAHPPGDAFVVTCYADDTEVLTREGWKLFKDVEVGAEGDLFATRNQSTHQLEWQHASVKTVADFDGDLIDLNTSNAFHLRVTPNHRVLTRWSSYLDGVRADGEIFKRADSITHRGAALPMLSAWTGDSPDTVQFGKFVWSTRDFVAFMGAWLAEGSLGRRNNHHKPTSSRKRPGIKQGTITLSQFPGTKGYEPYRELLTRMLGREPRRDGHNFVFWNTELWSYLRCLGKAPDKYILDEIKQWGRDDLAELLKFYWLGDGHTSRDGHGNESLKASTVSRRLADDMQEIAQKIGMSASVTKTAPGRGGVIGGRRIIGKHPTYRLSFNVSAARHIKPTRVPYTGKVYCVTVPNEVLYVRVNGRPVWCGNTATTEAQVARVVWRELGNLHAQAQLPGKLTHLTWKMRMPAGNEEVVAIGLKPADDNTSAFQGIHALRVLVIIDEAGGVAAQLWESADSLISNEFGRILVIGNTDDGESEFEKVCRPGSGWNVIKIAWPDTPNYTGEDVPQDLRHKLISHTWVEEKRRQWGETNSHFLARVMAQFPEVSEGGLIPSAWIRAASLFDSEKRKFDETDIPADVAIPNYPVELGMDVGGGADKTVIALRAGTKVRVVYEGSNPDVMFNLGVVMDLIAKTGAARTKIDYVGIGKGVVDRAKEIANDQATPLLTRNRAKTIIGINVGVASTDPDSYINLRAEAYWSLRERLQAAAAKDWTNAIDLDASDEMLLAQLVDLNFKRTSKGQVQIESKIEMKRRGKKSPDRADAIMLACLDGEGRKIKRGGTWGRHST